MKMMKKTLSLLLAAAIAMCISGTFVFAETTTPLTQFPDAPDSSQMYVYYPSTTAVCNNNNLKQPWYPVRGITGAAFKIPALANTNRFYLPYGPNANQTGVPQGQEFIFESLTAENAYAEVNSGYLMIETENITLKSSGHDEEKCSYGFLLESGVPFTVTETGEACSAETEAFDSTLHTKTSGERMAQVIVMFDPSRNDYNATIAVFDHNRSSSNAVEFVDASQWVKEGVEFNLKMLVNLDANTFDLYINDYPVLLSVKTKDAAATQVLATPYGKYNSTMVKPANVKFGGTSVYPLSAEAAAQCRQAAMEKALDCTFESNDEKGLLFYTYGGEEDTQTDVYKKHFVDNTANKNIECDGVSDLAITAEATDANNRFSKVLLSGSDMTAYDYDNLEYVYVSAPTVVDNTATVSGTYELAGGKGITYKPVVIQALYEDTDKKVLKELAMKETTEAYGTYGGTEFTPTTQLDKARAAAFIWGGKSKLVPLFPRVDFN